MKMNKKIVHMAVMRTVMEFYKMNDLAEKVVSILNSENDGGFELQSSKSAGFIIRRKKDVVIADGHFRGAIADAIKGLIEDRYDDVYEYILDTYEVELTDKCVSEDLVKDLFEISKSGRLIYIEADV